MSGASRKIFNFCGGAEYHIDEWSELAEGTPIEAPLKWISKGCSTAEKLLKATMEEETEDMTVTDSDKSISIAEVSHQDMLLQSYRQIFLITETFTAVVAATIAATSPINQNIVYLLAGLGIFWLIGYVRVTSMRAKVVEEWKEKSKELSGLYKKMWEKEKSAHNWAKGWLLILMPLSFSVFWGILLYWVWVR